MEKIINELEAAVALNEDARSLINLVVTDLKRIVGEDELHTYTGQLKILCKKFNTPQKILSLKNRVHRALVVELVANSGIQYYNHSYFNRAKLSLRHIELLKEVGPFLFVEGVMIVSKLNVIYNNYSKTMTEDHLYQICESSVDTQIMDILKMCDEKKRSVNNNLKKLELLFEIPETRMELIKELGKMLRESWKKQKSKNKVAYEVQPSSKFQKQPQERFEEMMKEENFMLKNENLMSAKEEQNQLFVKNLSKKEPVKINRFEIVEVNDQEMSLNEDDKRSQEESVILKQYSFAERCEKHEDQFYQLLGADEGLLDDLIF